MLTHWFAEMKESSSNASRPAPGKLVKLTKLPTGYEYGSIPSLVARQLWYYSLNLSYTKWRQGEQWRHPATEMKCKDDEGFLLHFLLEGELSHYLRNQTYIARKNDAVLLNLATPVAYRNESAKPVLFYALWFDGRGMNQVFEELDAASQPVFRNLNRPRLLGILRELIRVIDKEPPWHEPMTSALVARLLAELFVVRPPAAPKVSAQLQPFSTSVPVRRVLNRIARRYNRPWTLKEFSAATGVSLHHLSRLFKRETGISPKQFLNRYRVEHAKTLLAETQQAVDQVAQAVGIGNPKYFARLFRQLTGQSPRGYRSNAQRRTQQKRP